MPYGKLFWLNYPESFGVIRTRDGKAYPFSIADLESNVTYKKEKRVNFDIAKREHRRWATNIRK